MRGTIYYLNGIGEGKKMKFVDYFSDDGDLIFILMGLKDEVYKTNESCDLFVHWSDKDTLCLNHFVGINSYIAERGCNIRVHFSDTEVAESTMTLIFR